MTSEAPQHAFVWVWLPGATDPVVAGRIQAVGDQVHFAYGRSYRERPDAVPLYLPELPIRPGLIAPLRELEIAGVLADAIPDAWGQRVIMHSRFGSRAQATDPAALSPVAYLLASGSDRIGALDFQASASTYVPRTSDTATLEELLRAADRVEAGVPFSPALDRVLLHASSIGGARPKALIDDPVRGKRIAKFSMSGDPYPIVKGEYAAMELARRTGLDVAPVEVRTVLDRDVLLIDRFDRKPDGSRRMLASMLTILELNPVAGRWASYADLAEIIRHRFTAPRATLHELFARIVFNILVGNNDDHARNHAAFWDGSMLTLTPAYDICPQPRAGGETRQAIPYGPDGAQMSQVASVVAAAATYQLTEVEARATVDRQIAVIRDEWHAVATAAGMTTVQREYFWRRQFLNEYATYGY